MKPTSSSLLLIAFSSIASNAAELTVFNNNDSGAGSLRSVLAIANTNNQPDNITFDESISAETIILTSQELTISSEVSIVGPSSSFTISGNEERSIFTITSEGVVTLSNLNLIDGVANRGAGINNSGTLEVSNCLFQNHLGSVGCGIENNGAILVTDCRFEDNIASDDGAGFNNCINGSGVIDRCSFSGNINTNNGAGLSNFGTFTVTNSVFFNNQAVNEDDDGTGPLPTRNGGAIFNNGNLTLVSSTLFDNVSGVSGGAIYNRGNLELVNCTLSGNTSARGAAISSRSGVQLVQTTIANNIGTEGGGGLFFQDFGNLRVSNSIIANNTTPQVELAANLVNNTGGFFLFIDGPSIFSDDSITSVPNFNNPFFFRTNVDPFLGPLQDNGGPVPTHALLPDSPAIDSGSNFGINSNSPVTIETDSRGAPRIFGFFADAEEDTVDIGSFEAIPITVDSDGDGVPNDTDAFPEDPNESVDTDGDGFGDNSDPDPNDPNVPALGAELLINGSFEDTAIIPTTFVQLPANQVPGWDGNGNSFEFWANGFLGFESLDGEQFAELNAQTWQQTVNTTPGSTLLWSFYHRGRRTTDTMTISLGAPGSEQVIETVSTSPEEWVQYQGFYVVPSGQNTTSILFTPIGQSRATNLLDFVSLGEVSPDSDGDGVPDDFDDFPEDPNETQDSDGDGVGDNADPAPNNPDVPSSSPEVIISNLALGRPTSQITTGFGGVSSRAVDGDTNGNYSAGSVTHTSGNDNQPWWQVDLGQQSDIQNIEIWNRTNGNLGNRLSDFTLFVSDEDPSERSLADLLSDSTVSSFPFEGTPGEATTILANVTGRFIRIQLPGSANALSLAEVIVNGSASVNPPVTPDS